MLLLYNHPEKVLVELLPSSNQLNITIHTMDDDKEKDLQQLRPSIQHRGRTQLFLRQIFNDSHIFLLHDLESFQTLSLLVFAAVDALINDWYNLEVDILVPCAHCIDKELSPPYYFPFTVTSLLLLLQKKPLFHLVTYT